MTGKSRKPLLEVCAGSYEDCLAAKSAGASRVELNSALCAGGLTPTTAVLKKVKKDADLKVICMVRPRPGGFCYGAKEKEVMFAEAEELLEAGADGIAFGFLNPDKSVDIESAKAMTDLVHRFKAEAVFHRAFDVTKDMEKACQDLILCGVDRILTSGGQKTAQEGIPRIARLQKTFGDRIGILAGSGVNADNAAKIIEETGIHQVHASCRGYAADPTTSKGPVSYAYLPGPHESDYDKADFQKIKDLVESLERISGRD